MRVKAIGVLDCRAYITEKFGEEAHAKIKERMTPEDRDLVYAEHLVSVDWLPLNPVLNHLVTFDKVLGRGDGKADETMMRELARKHYKGIYGIMFRSAGPKEVVSKFHNIWKRYYDEGDGTVEFADDCNAVVKIVGCPSMPVKHERLVIPYIAEILRELGANNVCVKHTQCIAAGADCCTFTFSWSPAFVDHERLETTRS